MSDRLSRPGGRTNPAAQPREPGRARGRTSREPARTRRSLLRRLLTRRVARPAAVLLLLGTLGWSWGSGLLDEKATALGEGFVRMAGQAGVAIASIQVLGRENTTHQEILSALDVRQGAPLLAFDPYAARSRLETLPWVRKAAVERRLPGLIFITLEERRPSALWQLEGNLQVVDSDGLVIASADPSRFGYLPLLVGRGAPDHAHELFEVLAGAPELQSRVVAAVRVGERRWNVRLMPGIDIRLPENGAADAWRTLARLDREEGLLSRDLVVIDLRTPDRLVVRPAPGVKLLDPAKRGQET